MAKDSESKSELPQTERRIAGTLGAALIIGSAVLYYSPPYRTTSAKNSAGTTSQSTNASEPSTIVIAALIAGAALGLYAINGRRFTHFSGGNVGFNSGDGPSSPGESRGGRTADLQSLPRLQGSSLSRPIQTQISSSLGASHKRTTTIY